MKITQQQFAIEAEPIDGTIMCYPTTDGTIWLSVRTPHPSSPA
jgi:hypothetical protein